MNLKILKKIKKKLTLRALGELAWANKKATVTAFALFIGLLFMIFADSGLLRRMQLERDRNALLEKIRIAEDEQKALREQSRALDGDKKAIEKVAREKYGMIRRGEKVYKIVPRQQ
ncbi:MAG TPA: septum formation initiator family protein [Bacteroidota bacterium]|nr:septum formation initiator family protein [Bacteroidota bacterium]